MAVSKVVMPKLSEQMETGKIIKWLKQEGDRIQSGDILAEVETDKADVEMEAFGSGVLRKILVQAGAAAPVGALIGVIAEPGDDIASVVSQAGGAAPAAAAAPAPKPAPATAGATEMANRPAAVAPQPRREDPAARTPAPATGPTAVPPPAQPSAPSDGTGRVKASPLARKIAAQSGVDLRLLHGSGPGGRVVRRDVEAASTGGAQPAGVAVPVADGAEF
jgi:pyruvate dehydrogenase E2 component (dihydrolipoamide acetyltransferase)